MVTDQKLRDLLTKARKQANAGFGASQWSAVLQALGFKYEVTKKNRAEVLSVRITAPSGAVLDVDKKPNCRTISFGHVALPTEGHAECDQTDVEGFRSRCTCGAREWPCYRLKHTSLSQWAEDQGYPIDDLAARALGVPTMAEEREYKEYKARDWTHTGTCGVCNQNVKMEDGGQSTALVLHGYRRPGDGEVHGKCFGRGYSPHELSPDAARDYLNKVLVPTLGDECLVLEHLQTGKIKRLCVREADPRRGRPAEYVSSGDANWHRALQLRIEQQEEDIRRTTQEVQRFAVKVAAWKLDELPEVKMAKRFGGQP